MEALPAGTHLIHIGPQKTGSSALQGALHVARADLREHGVVYPGPGPKPRAAAEGGLGFARAEPSKGARKAWRALLAQVNDPGARIVCVSLEAFGRADDDQIRKIVTELGGEAPHVVAVARRYDRLLPSQWQERVKSGLRATYDEWLRIVLGAPRPDDPHWANLWVPHDTAALVRRWSEVLGPDRLTLVVADESDRGLLVRTFEQLLGLPPELLQGRGGQPNVSLTPARAELLRRLNVLAHESGWSDRTWQRLVRRGVVPAVTVAPRSPEESAGTVLPGWARERVVELSEQRVADLAQLPVRVVGDLEQLRVSPDDEAMTPGSPKPQVLPLDVVVAALDGMAKGAAVQLGQARRPGRDPRAGKQGKSKGQGKKMGPKRTGA